MLGCSVAGLLSSFWILDFGLGGNQDAVLR
jgi:hypothetical protein